MTPQHECPWVGGCRCVEERTLCSCGHQNAYHLRDLGPGLADDSWMLFQMQGEPAEWSHCEAGTAVDLNHEEKCSCARFTAVTS